MLQLLLSKKPKIQHPMCNKTDKVTLRPLQHKDIITIGSTLAYLGIYMDRPKQDKRLDHVVNTHLTLTNCFEDDRKVNLFPFQVIAGFTHSTLNYHDIDIALIDLFLIFCFLMKNNKNQQPL